MIVKHEDSQGLTKKLRFKPVSADNNFDSKGAKDMKNKDGKSASLFAFLHVELTRGYMLEHDEERFSARREKVYSFIKIPQELEKFMAYGFFQCADSLLFFVELKGSVFKKFDKNNLFQVSCSDVRERLHLSVLLFIVVLQTMKEYMWKEERFWILAPDCVLVLTFEVIIDWVKHAFITRFNEIPFGVYREYTVSLAYDVAQTRQKHAFSDHSDLVARRMGFIPLPLGVVITRVLVHAVKIDGEQKDLIPKEVPCTYNFKTPEKEVPPVKKTVQLKFEEPEDVISEPLLDTSVGAAAIFSNSAIDLNGVCYLNDKMTAQPKQEPQDFLESDLGDLSQSAPDIKAAAAAAAAPAPADRPSSPDAEGRIKRRSESEPNLAKVDDYEEAS
ncbi:hypothetical protein MSG28_009746 [Choristoneura fumiferana]|uniref:Uncharacterized protein n=1 Tax=Choristoneura fumiferana TaxID=7141 RepID=A0ACC0JCJ3_CHOFU|nr:hypothetical protein MSG28_009746 [Choristoneura fumiferana]